MPEWPLLAFGIFLVVILGITVLLFRHGQKEVDRMVEEEERKEKPDEPDTPSSFWIP